MIDEADTADYRARLLTRLDIGADPQVERYWHLLAVINGRSVPTSLAPVFAWFTAALHHHPTP